MKGPFAPLLALAVLLTVVAALGLTQYFRHDIRHQSHLSNASCRTFVNGNPQHGAISASR